MSYDVCRGFVLVAVLLLSAATSILVMASMESTTLALKMTQNYQHRLAICERLKKGCQ